jgi:hypothetical protein
MIQLRLKERSCAHCKARFMQARHGQQVCSIECTLARAEAKQARKIEKARQVERKQTREQLEAMKTLPTLKKEAQAEFNRYVRLRDAGKGCFVCGATLTLGGVGGGFDAGHIRSRSNADNLRFDERNVFGQCKPCNAVGSTKDHEMRAAAERMLGTDGAAALYADNAPVKWTRECVRAIRDEYRARANALAKAVER